MNQPILLYRSGSVYANETAAWAALDAVTHKKGQPIVAFYTLSSPVSGHHGSSTIGAIFAIGIGDGVGQYKACTSHDDMLIVAQSLNAHITQFNQMFEYDANHNAIKAKLDFYTTDGKSISAGGIGSGSSASLGALYQLVDVMANSSNTGVEGAVEGSVLAYDATAGKWKAIAQSEILPDMSGYYTKDETNSAINTAKSNLQGQVDTLKVLIPATASADNQLADKDFVNSSIATATAEFRGSFTSLDELKATSGNLNDYAFYLHTDDVGNSIVDRYKWTTAGWLYEYTLNNSSFTAEQWAALNSAITATLVKSYNSHLNNSAIHITAEERTAWNAKWTYNEETIKAVKVNAAVSADKATKLATPRTIWGQSFDGSANVDGRFSSISTDFCMYYNTNTLFLQVESTALILGEGTAATIPTYVLGKVIHFGSSLGSNAMTITNGGNALIGTTTDLNDRLQVYEVIGIQPNSDGYSGMYFYMNTGTKENWHISARSREPNKPFRLYYSPNKSTYNALVDITKGGNVLIGTTTDNGYKLDVNGKGHYSGDLICGGEVVAVAGEGTPAGVTDYSALTGKPAINGVTLVSGNNTLASLGIQAAGDYATNSGVTNLLANYADKTFVSNNYVGKSAFNSHTADTDIHITSAERVAWNAKWTYDEATIKAVKVTSASSADSIAWTGISGKPTTFTPSAHTHTASDVSGLPTSLKNPYALTFGSKTYDGSAAATITASDLGALTAHQSIYTLTLQVNSISQGTYNPASAAKTINITVPTKTSDITNDVGYITGITKSMVEGVLTGNITSHTHSYLPLSGGTISGILTIKANGYPLIEFKAGDTTYGYYGFSKTGVAAIWDTKNWHTLIHAGNYNSYAPTLTGTGASGTWGISISGNAASATKLQTPHTIWGQSFDGSANVDGRFSSISTDFRMYYNTNTLFLQVESTALILGEGTAATIPTYVLGKVIHFGSSLGSNAMTITNGGNALIGTTTDLNDRLQVYEVIGIQPNSGGYSGMYFYMNTGTKENWHISARSRETNKPFRLYYSPNKSTYNALVDITNGGNVLIGTKTDNGYKLQVNGSERVYGDLIVDGEVSALVA